VHAANKAKNGGVLKSDALFDPINPATEILTTGYVDDAQANLDHIIPRKDSKGCLCGTPTADNVAVISRVMNLEMSNHSPKYNLHRSLMYDQFVDCPDPSFGEFVGTRGQTPLDERELDELDGNEQLNDIERWSCEGQTRSAPFAEPVQTGGCSTTSSAGWFGIAFVLFGLRRRAGGTSANHRPPTSR
jgi:hypothetical protein